MDGERGGWTYGRKEKERWEQEQRKCNHGWKGWQEEAEIKEAEKVNCTLQTFIYGNMQVVKTWYQLKFPDTTLSCVKKISMFFLRKLLWTLRYLGLVCFLQNNKIESYDCRCRCNFYSVAIFTQMSSYSVNRVLYNYRLILTTAYSMSKYLLGKVKERKRLKRRKPGFRRWLLQTIRIGRLLMWKVAVKIYNTQNTKSPHQAMFSEVLATCLLLRCLWFLPSYKGIFVLVSYWDYLSTQLDIQYVLYVDWPYSGSWRGHTTCDGHALIMLVVI